MAYEYVVIPAPKKGVKAKGVKAPEDRFAHALTETMNAKAAEGWDYVRTDTLPAEERHGLTGSKTVYQNMMVFRRPLVPQDTVREAPTALLAAPAPEPEIEDDVPPMPAFTARSEDRMMHLEDDPEAGRAEPKLRAE